MEKTRIDLSPMIKSTPNRKAKEEKRADSFFAAARQHTRGNEPHECREY